VSVTVLLFALLAAAYLVPGARLLAGAAWVVREPRAALVLWQGLGFASGVALIGCALAVALAPLGRGLASALWCWGGAIGRGELFASLGLAHGVLLVVALAALVWLVGVTLWSACAAAFARRRHRELIELVARPLPGGAFSGEAVHVLEHPGVAAYCVPGLRPRVVVTSGALRAFSEDELAAVLAHEGAHLREHHDLVLLPFAAWALALPGLAGAVRARSAVAHLLELVADDRASAARGPRAVARALARCGAMGAVAPACALNGEGPLVARVERLLRPPARSPLARWGAWLGAFGVSLAPFLIAAL
jgi:Zn-dependent protease with chaperone function